MTPRAQMSTARPEMPSSSRTTSGARKAGVPARPSSCPSAPGFHLHLPTLRPSPAPFQPYLQANWCFVKILNAHCINVLSPLLQTFSGGDAVSPTSCTPFSQSGRPPSLKMGKNGSGMDIRRGWVSPRMSPTPLCVKMTQLGTSLFQKTTKTWQLNKPLPRQLNHLAFPQNFGENKKGFNI